MGCALSAPGTTVSQAAAAGAETKDAVNAAGAGHVHGDSNRTMPALSSPVLEPEPELELEVEGQEEAAAQAEADRLEAAAAAAVERDTKGLVNKNLKVINDEIEAAAMNLDARAKVGQAAQWFANERVILTLDPDDSLQHALLVRVLECLLGAQARAGTQLEYHVMAVLLTELVLDALFTLYGFSVAKGDHAAKYKLYEDHITTTPDNQLPWAAKVDGWVTMIAATTQIVKKLSNVPTSELLTQLATIGDGVALLAQVSKKEGLKTVGGFLFSLVKSVATGRVDDNLLRTAKDAMRLGAKLGTRNLAKGRVDIIWCLHQLKTDTINRLSKRRSETKVQDIKSEFIELYEQIRKQAGCHEVVSAWVMTLTELACLETDMYAIFSSRPHSQRGEHLIEFFTKGDTQFKGLLEYASFGEDQTESKFKRAKAVATAAMATMESGQAFNVQIKQLVENLVTWVKERAQHSMEKMSTSLLKNLSTATDLSATFATDISIDLIELTPPIEREPLFGS